MRRRSLSSPLFPYTTLFRSAVARSLPQLCYESGDLFDSAVEFHGFVLVGVFCFRTNVLLRLLLVEVAFEDRKSTRLNSSHSQISYAVFCLKKKTLNFYYCTF